MAPNGAGTCTHPGIVRVTTSDAKVSVKNAFLEGDTLLLGVIPKTTLWGREESFALRLDPTVTVEERRFSVGKTILCFGTPLIVLWLLGQGEMCFMGDCGY